MIDYNNKINPLFSRNWALTLSKFEIFNLTQFDKIIYLDADIMMLKNIDHLFEYPHLTSALDGEYFNIWPDKPHFNAGILVIEPNSDEYKKL
jgi:alpha-N-acetylglucosamine transferase